MRQVRLYKKSKTYISKRMLAPVVSVFVAMVSIMPLINSKTVVPSFFQRVVLYWSQSHKDFGKLKFVNVEDEKVIQISSVNGLLLQPPFDMCVTTKTTNGECEFVSQNGLFKPVLEGVVESIREGYNRKTITINHGEGVKSIYQFFGILGVATNDVVNLKTILGNSNDNKIILTLLVGEKIIEDFEICDGVLDVIG